MSARAFSSDGHLLTANSGSPQGVCHTVCDGGLHIHEREVVEDLNRTNDRAGNAGLVGNRPYQIAGSKAGPASAADP